MLKSAPTFKMPQPSELKKPKGFLSETTKTDSESSRVKKHSVCKPLTLTFALIGDAKAGKTSLAMRFCNNDFTVHYAPTNICQLHQSMRPLGLGQSTVLFHLWELANNQIHNATGGIGISSAAKMALNKCSAIFYVYDISNPKALEKAAATCFVLAKDPDYTIQSITFIGNKQDLIDNQHNSTALTHLQAKAHHLASELRVALQFLGKKITVDAITLSSKTSENQSVENVFIQKIGPSFFSMLSHSTTTTYDASQSASAKSPSKHYSRHYEGNQQGFFIPCKPYHPLRISSSTVLIKKKTSFHLATDLPLPSTVNCNRNDNFCQETKSVLTTCLNALEKILKNIVLFAQFCALTLVSFLFNNSAALFTEEPLSQSSRNRCGT